MFQIATRDCKDKLGTIFERSEAIETEGLDGEGLAHSMAKPRIGSLLFAA
jgi:hypothetical protein